MTRNMLRYVRWCTCITIRQAATLCLNRLETPTSEARNNMLSYVRIGKCTTARRESSGPPLWPPPTQHAWSLPPRRPAEPPPVPPVPPPQPTASALLHMPSQPFHHPCIAWTMHGTDATAADKGLMSPCQQSRLCWRLSRDISACKELVTWEAWELPSRSASSASACCFSSSSLHSLHMTHKATHSSHQADFVCADWCCFRPFRYRHMGSRSVLQ